ISTRPIVQVTDLDLTGGDRYADHVRVISIPKPGRILIRSLSPDAEKIVWLMDATDSMMEDGRAGGETKQPQKHRLRLVISRRDGTDAREVGYVLVDEQDVSVSLWHVRWLNDGKGLCFAIKG